jgi:hypothetical protein
MLLVDPVITRIDDEVPALKGRVEGAAELAALVREDALPQVMPAAFVVPVGLQGGRADAVSGLFRQNYVEVVGVVLIVAAAGDATGALALPELQDLVGAGVTAVCGWAPDAAVGVFELRRGALVSLNAGAVIYQLDFGINSQLRIET